MKATAFVGMFIGLPAAVGILMFQLWEWAFRKPEIIDGFIRPLNPESDTALEPGEAAGLKLLTSFIPLVGGLVYQVINGMMLSRQNKLRLFTVGGVRQVFVPRRLKAGLGETFFASDPEAIGGTLVLQDVICWR